MKKVLLVLALLIVGAGVFFYMNFEAGLRRGIEIAASNALGTQVTVSGVGLSPLSGSGSISGLTIANPEGFEAPTLMELGSLDVAINLKSLVSDVIEIEHIIVNDVQVTYETTVVNDNIRTLLNNLPNANAAPVVEASPDAQPGKQVIIRDLQLLNPQINLHTRIASAPVPLPNIELRDIGEQSNGVTVAEAARQILTALNRSLATAGVPDMDVLVDSAKQQLEEGARKVGDAVDDLSDGVRSLFNRQ